jgi:signal transduction histidine kinase
MKLQKKLVAHYIKFLVAAAVLVFTLSLISSWFFSIIDKWYLFGDIWYPFGVFTSILLLPTLALMVFGFLYGKNMSAPIFYFLEWVDRLSQGNYTAPTLTSRKVKSKEGKFSTSFQMYQELTEKMENLTNRLKQNEIERKELEEVRQDWTSGVTHDLKTPLSYIQGYSTMLLSNEYEWTDAEHNHFVEIIQSKATHMQQLIDDLSDAFQFERGEIPLHLKQLELLSFVEDIVGDVKQQPTSLSQHIYYTTDKENLLYRFDDHLLRRALTNFLMNAVQHNPSGTVITISVYTDLQDGALIKIADNGVGMTEKEKERLFQHYYRGTSTDTPVSGTGLGMAIAKQFIDAHKGTIQVQSTPGHGTTIMVSLPQLSK